MERLRPSISIKGVWSRRTTAHAGARQQNRPCRNTHRQLGNHARGRTSGDGIPQSAVAWRNRRQSDDVRRAGGRCFQTSGSGRSQGAASRQRPILRRSIGNIARSLRTYLDHLDPCRGCFARGVASPRREIHARRQRLTTVEDLLRATHRRARLRCAVTRGWPIIRYLRRLPRILARLAEANMGPWIRWRGFSYQRGKGWVLPPYSAEHNAESMHLRFESKSTSEQGSPPST